MSEKSKKAGNKKDWCKSYRARGQRERNKRRRLTTYCIHNPNDRQAAKVLDYLGGPCTDRERGASPS